MLPVIKKSMTKLIRAVLMNKAIDCLYAKLILKAVLLEIFSISTIKWYTLPITNLLNKMIVQEIDIDNVVAIIYAV
jgi:hypothetical protein